MNSCSNSIIPPTGLGIGILGTGFLYLIKYLYNSIIIHNRFIYKYQIQTHHFIDEELYFEDENENSDDEEFDNLYYIEKFA